MSLRELLANFTIGVDDSQLRSADKRISSFAHTLGEVGKLAAEAFAFHEAKSFIENQIDMGAELQETAERLGISTDELQRFQYAAGQVGISTDQAATGLRFFNKNVGDALDGTGEAVQVFQRMHIALKDAHGAVRPVSELLPEIADGFEKLESPQQQTATAMKIFGRQGAALIPLLKEGSKGVAELSKRFTELGGGVGPDFLKDSEKAKRSTRDLSFAFSIFESRIAVAILPTFTEFVELLTKGAVYLQRLANETNAVQVALYAMAAVVGVLAAEWLIVNAEIVAVLAIFGALFLIVEDIYTLFTGGDSVIGRFIDSLFGVGASKKFVAEVRDAVQEVINVFTALGPIATAVGQILSAIWTVAKPVAEGYFKWLAESTGAFLKMYMSVLETITKATGAVLQEVGKRVNLVGDLIGNKTLLEVGTNLAAAGVGVQQAVNPTPEVPERQVGAYAPERGERTFNQSNRVEVNVHGGQTNAETGRTVADAVRGALTQGDVNAAGRAFGVGL